MMSVIQARLPQGLLDEIDKLVGTGVYNNRSDVVRDAVRRLSIDRMIGIFPNTRDSVKEIRKIRRKLSKEKVNLNKINKLAE